MDKRDVIKITLELIKEKKLEKASIGEIVKRLELSPGNLYYHFKSKNDIYKEAADYSAEEIIKNLDRVKLNRNKEENLFRLTKRLINFFEERDEILFFLISMKSSCYLDTDMEAQNFLINFKKELLNNEHSIEYEKSVILKLRMFLGSLYEVLYATKLVNSRNLSEEEIKKIHISFWGNKAEENSRNYEYENLKFGLS
jgi:AcrR family transcriptional regulator